MALDFEYFLHSGYPAMSTRNHFRRVPTPHFQYTSAWPNGILDEKIFGRDVKNFIPRNYPANIQITISRWVLFNVPIFSSQSIPNASSK